MNFAVRPNDPRMKAAVICVPLVLYIYSLSPFVQFSDAGEMQTVPYILGIAHPVGSPLFTMIGFLFSHFIPIGTVAWRISLMCAIAMIIALSRLYCFRR